MEGNVISILRGYTCEQVRIVCETLCQGEHIRNVEITLNTEGAYDTIRHMVEEFGDKLHIGAGTVVTFAQLKKVITLGVEFVLSPVGYTKEMIDYCHEHQVIAIPAAFTPHEIHTQFLYGADIVKVFPANELSWKYAKKVMEPLGDLPLLAVGGVQADNIQEVLASGYHYAGSAGGIFPKAAILQGDKAALRNALRTFEKALDGGSNVIG